MPPHQMGEVCGVVAPLLAYLLGLRPNHPGGRLPSPFGVPSCCSSIMFSALLSSWNQFLESIPGIHPDMTSCTANGKRSRLFILHTWPCYDTSYFSLYKHRSDITSSLFNGTVQSLGVHSQQPHALEAPLRPRANGLHDLGEGNSPHYWHPAHPRLRQAEEETQTLASEGAHLSRSTPGTSQGQ